MTTGTHGPDDPRRTRGEVEAEHAEKRVQMKRKGRWIIEDLNDFIEGSGSETAFMQRRFGEFIELTESVTALERELEGMEPLDEP